MRETRYRLSIAPELEPFRPELEHASAFLDSVHFVARAPNGAPEGARVLHYGPSAPPNAVAIPAVLFPRCVRVDGNGIHPVGDALSAVCAPEGALRPRANGAAAGAALGYDALGLIFLLLSRLEERDHPERDRYGRFPVTAALFPPQEVRLHPFADRAARDLAAALTGDAAPPSRTRYAVKLTHDVDMLRGYHRAWEPLRLAGGDLLKRGRPRAAVARLGAYFADEPWRSARRLMDLAERRSLQSHFYFMGPSRDPMDSPYAATMAPLLRKVGAEARARGHVVGFHPGFATATNPEEWRRQRQGLETVLGCVVSEGRQHVLRYDAAVTPRIWSESGMALDCTPSYPEAVGFRTGTCRPHQAYDLVARRSLPLRQLSTAAMEFGLFGGKYADLPVDRAVADTLWAAETCREFGGTFTLLFHTGRQDARRWAWLEAVLERVAP
jgi:hypothetical protein